MVLGRTFDKIGEGRLRVTLAYGRHPLVMHQAQVEVGRVNTLSGGALEARWLID